MIPDFNNPDNICSEDPRKIYPFKGINYTAEEINRLLAAIDKKASIDMIRDGLSAYEVAVANGYKGSVDQWLMSLRGPRGEALQFEDLTAAEIEVLKEPAYKAGEEVKDSTDKLLQDTEVKVNEVLAKGDAASQAATKANEAASSATAAAGKANEATDKANEAAGKVNTAVDNATAATGNANAAADKANAAADKATNEGLFKTPQDLSEEEQGQVKQNLGIEDLMASLETQAIDGFSETVSSTTSLKTEDNIIPKSLDFAIVDLGSTDGRDVPDSPSMSVVLAKVPGSGRVKMQGYLKTTHEEYNIQVVEGAAEKDALNVNIITDTETTYKVFQIRYLSSIDSSKFKGSYGQLSQLQAAYPTAKDGSYAFVGNPRHLYEWATNAWTDRGEFTTSVDQAIDPQSERAIANKAVSAKLTELENETNKIIFTDNAIANTFIKEINIKFTDSKYVSSKLNFYNNFSGTTGIRIYGITEQGEETSLGTFSPSTYYNEETNIFEVNNDNQKFFAVIDWSLFVSLNKSSLPNVLLTGKAFNDNFCNSFMLREHKSNIENPHKVTKEQVGLSNVDNTSDTQKPISAPQKEFVKSELKEFRHSDNEDLNKGLFGLYLFPQSEYDSFKVTIFNGNGGNYLLRLVGVKDGVDTNIKNFEKDSVVNNILKLDYWGYALIDFSLFDKQYVDKSDVFNTDEQHNTTLISLVNSNTELITTYIQAYSDTSFGVYEDPSVKNPVIFVGVDAIARAINTYKDKGNSLNRYVVKAHGLFVAKSAAQFTATDNGEYAIFALQSTNYISVQGDGMNATLVSAELPDNLGTSFRYDMYSPIIQNGNNSFITDMTISGINCRYTIHTDRSSTNKSDFYEQHIERCRLISKANTGDAYEVWKSYVPHGIGISNGMKMYMEDCEIVTDSSVLYVHSNANFTFPFLYKCKNIKCIQKTDASLKFAHVAAISAGIKGYFLLENVDGLGRFDYGESVRNPLPTDLADIVIKGNNNGLIGVVKPNIPKYQLRVSVNDTAIPHTIIYDKTKNAYNVIIKGNNLVGGNSDVIYQDGQAYKKGGVGFSAWCMGLLPVMDTSQDVNAKLGVRLGDCSVTNKTLGIVIDDTNYSIVLDQNYTSMSNDDIVEDINSKLTVLSVPCTADLYSISAETYMDLDSVITLQNTSGKDIIKGLAVKRSTYGFDLAVNDSECIGILLDDVIENGVARILTKGYISKYGGRYLVRTVGGTLTANSRYGVNADSKLELNENGKFLAVNSDAVIF